MGFLKDLIDGHEAFFETNETEKISIAKFQKTKLTLIENSKEEGIKVA